MTGMLLLHALITMAFASDLSVETVSRLKVAWTYQTDATPPDEQAGRIAAFEATPVLSGGLLYVITPFNQAIALDPETGVERWRYDPHLANHRQYSEASARGVTVAGGRVYFGTLDARLIALDADSGRLVWQTRLGANSNDGNYQVTSPPVIVGTTIIVGSSIGDNGRAAMDRGTVRAFDVKTGAPRWTWDPTPPGATGAANAWAPMSVDAERDLVLIPTGSASPEFCEFCGFCVECRVVCAMSHSVARLRLISCASRETNEAPQGGPRWCGGAESILSQPISRARRIPACRSSASNASARCSKATPMKRRARSTT
jgi:hypothetical protein